MFTRRSAWEADNLAELLLVYATGGYTVAVALALGLWLWARHEMAREPATTQRGIELHAATRERAKRQRNLLLLTLVPVAVFLLLPGLPVIHPLIAVACLLILLLISSVVIRHTLRFVRGNF